MIRGVIFAFAIAALGAGLTAQQPTKKPYTLPPQTTPPQAEGKETVDITGCVSHGTSPATFILTAKQNRLTSGVAEEVGGTVPSPTYELFGHVSELQGLVGHEVEVKGVTDKRPEKTTSVGGKKKGESNARGTSGSDKGGKPTVTTDTKAKVEVRRLDVESVRSVAGACQ